MREAALATCDSLGIHDDSAVEYLCDLVAELMPRVEVGLTGGDLRGVFLG